MLISLPVITNLPPNTIQTTFVEQAPEHNWDQPWQDACEEASLLTLYYYKENLIPQKPQIVSDLRHIFAFNNFMRWPDDINQDKMAEIAAINWGYKHQFLVNPTVEDIKNSIDSRNPVIITANGRTLFKENKNFTNGGPWYHSLVILGYNDKTGTFIVHDVGTRKGAYFSYTYQTLLDSIHDLPTNNDKHDIQSGTKKALVLL